MPSTQLAPVGPEVELVQAHSAHFLLLSIMKTSATYFSLRLLRLTLLPLVAASLSACLSTMPQSSIPQNVSGVSAMNVDPTRQGPVSGVGLEGHDMNTMSDKMVRDILTSRRVAAKLASLPAAPVIQLDGTMIENRSAQAMDRNHLANRFRVRLNRAADGRLEFVSREDAALVQRERDLKRSGVTTTGVTGLTKAVDGVDFFITGQITTSEARNNKTGLVQRNTLLAFKLVDAETQRMVWEDEYEFTRAAADDVIYR